MERFPIPSSRNEDLRDAFVNTCNGFTTIFVHNITDYRILGDDSIIAIDPNGGPYIHCGMILENEHHTWRLATITHFFEKNTNREEAEPLLIIQGYSEIVHPHYTTAPTVPLRVTTTSTISTSQTTCPTSSSTHYTAQ